MLLPALLFTLLPLQELDDGLEDQRARLRAHYERVEAELRAADSAALDAERRGARTRALDALRAYRLRGDFGRDSGDGGRRMLFVDSEGRRCAVAEILHHFGEDELIGAVARTRNQAFVQELATNALLVSALDRIGLTPAEAARIQAPGIRVNDEGGFSRPIPTRSSSPGPAAPASPAGPTRGRTAVPAPSTTPTGAVATSGTRSPSSGSEPNLLTSWWTWWELHKLEWLVPDRSAPRRAGLADDVTRSESDPERYRRDVAPILFAALSDPDAQVRAAGAVAYARVVGEPAVDALLPLLEDANLEVRNQTLLALGATRSESAVHDLLRIAHSGRLGEGVGRISPDVQPLSMIALALARSRGYGAGTEVMLPRDRSDDFLVDATAMQPFLASSEELRAELRELSGLFAGGERVSRLREVNERALEALRFDTSEETFAALLHALGSRNVEVRRSTATTLGRVAQDAALAPLMTAFEVEKEPLTRSLLLVAIGRRGGEQAQEFLAHTLARGPQSQRAWCALALGVLAREANDPSQVAVLHEALDEEGNRAARGAYLIALGLGRDASAESLLLEELARADQETRSVAAIALGMLATPNARAALRSALAEERSPFVRAALAQGLALVRAPEDMPALVAAMRDLRVPAEAVQHAAASAFHGSPDLTPLLAALAADEDANAVARAAAIQALGMLLDDVEPFRLGMLSRDVNYSVFPAWLNAPLQSTL